MSSHAGYVPGELDHTSPLDLSTLEGDVTITAQAGYINPTEGRQLVDMSNWCENNPDMIVGRRFTEAAKEYFKTVKPTTLNGFINAGKALVDATPINLLDTSECTSFNGAFLIRSESINEKKNININLTGLITSNVTDMTNAFGYSSENGLDNAFIDISGWDTSKVKKINNIFFLIYQAKSVLIKGIIDLSSVVPGVNAYNLFSNYNQTSSVFVEPIKLKNVPSDIDWQNMGFTSEDQFQILSYR